MFGLLNVVILALIGVGVSNCEILNEYCLNISHF